jgi:hypothetical protein
MSSIALNLQVLTNLLWCGRRNQSCPKVDGRSTNKVTQKTENVELRNGAEPHAKTFKKTSPEGDSANDSTTDGSDSEVSSVDVAMPTRQASPSQLLVKPPPGLEAPSAHTLMTAGTSKATCSELDEVLKKLSPEDAMTVQRLLESKQAAPQQANPKPRMASTNDEHGIPKAQSLIALLNQTRQTKDDAGEIHTVPPWRKPTPVNEGSLRDNLRKMGLIDSKRIFMVRQIKQLGVNSPTILKNYFKQFGPVTDVFVTHAIDKQNQGRVRPASVGFVAMDKIEDVLTVLQREHVIRGLNVATAKYEHRPIKESDQP